MYKRQVDGSNHNLFDFLVKNVSFGPTELTTDALEVGGAIFTFPKTSAPCVITMTVRDSSTWQLYNWFNTWVSEVVNNDGTFNLPFKYKKLLKIKTYKDDEAGSEVDLWSDEVYPTKMGDISMDVSAEGFVEFPIVFQQFRSLPGIKKKT